MADFSRFSSVTNMLIDLNIPSLEHRRQVSSITVLYKIVHNLIDISPVDLIPVTSNSRGHDQRFHHIYARTNQYSNSFFPRSIRLWNSLPPDLIQQQSLQVPTEIIITFPYQSAGPPREIKGPRAKSQSGALDPLQVVR